MNEKAGEKKEMGLAKRNLWIGGFFVAFVFVVLVLNLVFEKDVVALPTCGDGTFYDSCSLNKPFFCDGGVLVEKASVCGCDGMQKSGEVCVSEYQNKIKEISLKYVLRGEEKEIYYSVYGGVVDYLSGLPKTIFYSGEEKPSRGDFKIRNIEEKEQRKLLLPLVAKIQNYAETEEDQVRIAISLVQNIDFGESEKNATIGNGQSVDYSRYPYEVLYDEKGVCGEKVELLAFLLKEMGYGLGFFYHADENHESLGIKCPVKYSLGGTGYCFVETTGPAILTDNSIDYVGDIKLGSEPEVFLLSNGASLPDDLYEYGEAEDLMKIREDLGDGKLNWFEHSKFDRLQEKYGLVEFYNPD